MCVYVEGLVKSSGKCLTDRRTRSKAMWFEYISLQWLFLMCEYDNLSIETRRSHSGQVVWVFIWLLWVTADRVHKTLHLKWCAFVCVCVCLWMCPWARDQNFTWAVALRNWRWMDAEKDPFQNDGMSESPEMWTRSARALFQTTRN